MMYPSLSAFTERVHDFPGANWIGSVIVWSADVKDNTRVVSEPLTEYLPRFRSCGTRSA